MWFGGFYAILAGVTLWRFYRKVGTPARRRGAVARVCLVWSVLLVLTLALVLLPVAFDSLGNDLSLLVCALLMIVIGWWLQHWLRSVEKVEQREKARQVR